MLCLISPRPYSPNCWAFAGLRAVKVILHGNEIVPVDSEPNSTSNGVHPVASDNTKPSEGVSMGNPKATFIT